MASEARLTLKFKLKEETHRVSLDKLPTHAELVETVRQLFPSIDQFILKYTDDQNDLITIISDLDLTEAFNVCAESKLLLLTIFPTSTPTKKPTKKEKENPPPTLDDIDNWDVDKLEDELESYAKKFKGDASIMARKTRGPSREFIIKVSQKYFSLKDILIESDPSDFSEFMNEVCDYCDFWEMEKIIGKKFDEESQKNVYLVKWKDYKEITLLAKEDFPDQSYPVAYDLQVEAHSKRKAEEEEDKPKKKQNSEEMSLEKEEKKMLKQKLQNLRKGSNETCTCCHICKNSIVKKRRQFVNCSSCNYVYCKSCFTTKLTEWSWENVKDVTNWICRVCLGTCKCQRCTIRGVPRWYGHMAIEKATQVGPNWKEENNH